METPSDSPSATPSATSPSHTVISADWVITVDPDDRVVDDGAGSLITMDETVERGPGAALPDSVVDPFIAWRNREALRRLALIAEGRAGLR